MEKGHINIMGNKVVLRAIEEQDRKMLLDLIQDPEIAKVTGGYSRPSSCNRQISWFRSTPFSAGGVHSIIADQRNPREGLGVIVLSNVDSEAGTAQISIKLVRSVRRKGYGQDAVNALVSYAFLELGLNQIYSNILESNKASQKLFEKCGFIQKSVHKSRVYRDGNSRNIYVYERSV